jgi:hypothetical protein
VRVAMARPKNFVPTYCRHKSSGTARTRIHGCWVTLGPYDSPESRAAYARLVAVLAVAPHAAAPSDPSVNELLLAS